MTAAPVPPGRVLRLPAPALVLLVGPAGVGKSTFARRWFPETAIVSSDRCRAWLTDDEDDQSATADAFELVHALVDKRLRRNRLTAVDATNLQVDARRPLLALAHRHQVQAVAVVFHVDPKSLAEQNAARAEAGGRRAVPMDILTEHLLRLGTVEADLSREDLAAVLTLESPEAARSAVVQFEPLPCDRRAEAGPFDLIGDVHGCIDELVALLRTLGYCVAGGAEMPYTVRPPPGRRAVFLGDLVDRGPGVPEVLALVETMVSTGAALAVAGNHEAELLRVMRGGTPRPGYGLEASIEQLARISPARAAAAARFLGSLPDHLVLDGGRLVAAHAPLPPGLHGRSGRLVREMALRGDGARLGQPGPPAWATQYPGEPIVCYGHTPVAEAEWFNGTINLDTGCVFGGALTALRYPERTLVRVPSARRR